MLGRPKMYDVVLQARIPRWMYDAMREAANEQLLSMSDVARAALLRSFPKPDTTAQEKE